VSAYQALEAGGRGPPTRNCVGSPARRAKTCHVPPASNGNYKPRATGDTFAFNCYPRLWPSLSSDGLGGVENGSWVPVGTTRNGSTNGNEEGSELLRVRAITRPLSSCTDALLVCLVDVQRDILGSPFHESRSLLWSTGLGRLDGSSKRRALNMR